MPTSPVSAVIPHLMADLGPDGGTITDHELLARFLGGRDEPALAALVRRHAPMVWGVCRRHLHHADAEDAFQATFLVLVRKAADVPTPAVANWLYGVARQTSIRLRATTAKRRRRETQVATMPEPTVAETRDADLRSVIDEELSRLPDHYRGVVVLCDLEGLTRKEAARQLGMPEGSVASRLARARAMLGKRLTRRGVAFSGGLIAAATPPALVATTIKSASLLAVGRAAGVSARVVSLADKTVKAMVATKLQVVLAMTFALAALAGAAGLIYQPDPTDRPVLATSVTESDARPLTKEERLRRLVDQVLAAHGGEDRLRNLTSFTMTVKHSNGETQHYFVQQPRNFRWETTHRDSTSKRIVILFPHGRRWWTKEQNREPRPFMPTGAESPVKHWYTYVKYFGPRLLLRLKDPDYKVTLVDEDVKVDGRPAEGVDVAGLRMYFDKQTHLLVKHEGGYPSPVYFTDYKTFAGIPIATREHDGYLEPEVTDFRVVEKFDAGLFERP